VYRRQLIANAGLIELARKHNVKLIASNDVHFVNTDDAIPHDILICLNTQSDYDDEDRMRYTKQEWLKTQDEMNLLFADIPEALETRLKLLIK